MKTAAFMLVFVSCVSVSAFGQEFTVNSFRDALDNNPGDRLCSTGMLVGGVPECTLRAALQEANSRRGIRGGTLISLPAGVFTLSLGLFDAADEDQNQRSGAWDTATAVPNGDLDIEGNITIDGRGPGESVIDGGGLARVFHIPFVGLNYTTTITDLTVRNGRSRGTFGSGRIVQVSGVAVPPKAGVNAKSPPMRRSSSTSTFSGP